MTLEAFPSLGGLHHYAYRCRDGEETRRFYEDLLGLPLSVVVAHDRVPSTNELHPYCHIFFQLGDGSYLAFFDLFDGQGTAPDPATPSWVNHLALRVESREALDGAKERLETAGVEVTGIVDHGWFDSIYFFDPNGIRLELVWPTATPEELADRASRAHAALAATADGEGLTASAGRELVVLDVPSGVAFESLSGLQMGQPRIYGALTGPERATHGVIVMHPSSNFMGHYLLDPLAERGVAVLALNSRYVNNDSTLIMERVLQDLGTGIRFLRERGVERLALVGNSGGAGLACFYQAQSECLTISDTPGGDRIDLTAEQLPRADGIILAAAHPGRAELLTSWLDVSMLDEADPLGRDPHWDIYDPQRSPPFPAAFVDEVRVRQRRRNERITEAVEGRLRYLRSTPDGPADQALLVFRTYADPRFVDRSLDPNDRAAGGTRGEPRTVNYAANGLGRYSTLTSWLSQWSVRSRAGGPQNLAATSVPVLQVEFTADQSTFPSDVAAWTEAAGDRETYHRLSGATHYLRGQPHLLNELCDVLGAVDPGVVRVAALS